MQVSVCAAIQSWTVSTRRRSVLPLQILSEKELFVFNRLLHEAHVSVIILSGQEASSWIHSCKVDWN